MKADKNREIVDNVFSSVSGKYDIMNDAMSFGMHRLWKTTFTNLISVKTNDSFMDLSCGTGDIAKILLKKYNERKISVTLCDPEEKMLNLAKKNIINNGISLEKISFLQSQAEDLQNENEFDFITLSFGIRNFSNIQQSLQNCLKALKNGGFFYCMEFSPKLSNQTFAKFYKMHLNTIIPFLGKVIAKDEDSYKYLSQSIQNFLTPDEFLNEMKNAGFKNIQNVELMFGGVQIYFGEK